MSTLVEKTRAIISSESDDFFENDIILTHLNSALEDVVSIALQRERNAINSLRVLDSLRASQESLLNSKTDKSFYFEDSFAKPQDLKEIQNVFIDEVILKEITNNNLAAITYGTLNPSSNEKYYNIATTQIRVFTDTDDDETVTLYYIKNPQEIIGNTTSLQPSLERLASAVLYSAAHRLIMQETVRTVEMNPMFKREFTEQLELNMY